MSRRLTTALRLLGAITLGVAGYGAGTAVEISPQSAWLSTLLTQDELESLSQLMTINQLLVSIAFAMFGLAFGYVLAPTIFRPFHMVYEELREVPPSNILGGTIGLGIGLTLSALLAIPIQFLPSPWGLYLPFIVALALGYLGVAIVGGNPSLYLNLIHNLRGGPGAGQGQTIVLDTSVIIDGRVSDVAETGFLGHRLIVPRFVLAELQQIADSSDSMRRNRGRRGLEILNRLQQSEVVDIEISDIDFPGADNVDRKLVRLAEKLRGSIMTNDFNLNKVAEIQGIRVLNLNELANAVKTLLLPGEHLNIKIIQEGKEHGQGVGYLEDGTMVVVDQGRERLDEQIPVTVTRVLQTVAGRMIFASPNLGDN